MSFDDGLILGMMLGGGGSGGGGSEYVNNDPDYALYKALPEPNANQIVMLIRIADGTEHNYVGINYDGKYSSEDISENEGEIDWGDGTSASIGKYPDGSHAYATPGDYIITVTDNSGGKIESVCCYNQRNYGYPIAMKVGSELVYDDGFDTKCITSASNFKYIKFLSDYIWTKGFTFEGTTRLTRIDFLGSTKPDKLLNRQFNNCYALDFENLLPLFTEITEIGNDALTCCYNLKKLSLPKCTKVGNDSIIFCHALREVNMPLCAAVGDYGLSNNYSLNKVTLSDSCSFGSYAMNYCYSLIPTPNGVYPY